MNAALNSYSAQQHQADLVREARRARPPKRVPDDVEGPKPRRRQFLLPKFRLSAS